MSEKLIFALPSKGRLMEQALETLGKAGLELRRLGHERGYQGEIVGLENAEVNFVSASEIATLLKSGAAHLGITGEDLVREQIASAEERVKLIKPLGFGHADVIVAVPNSWIDVNRVNDLEGVGRAFRRTHGRRMRVATKYVNLTRRFLAEKGVTSYRIVESPGATEGTPAAGSAELIVDITTTGNTLRANGLRVLEDGIILRSEANLVASNVAPWTPAAREAENEIMSRLGA